MELAGQHKRLRRLQVALGSDVQQALSIKNCFIYELLGIFFICMSSIMADFMSSISEC